jgi:hypothetical protein
MVDYINIDYVKNGSSSNSNQLCCCFIFTDNPVILNGKLPSISHQQQPLSISIEAQQIIQKIPDISYMTSKTLVFPQKAASSSNSLL